MKRYFLIIVAAALTAVLVGAVTWQANRLSHIAESLSAEQAHNAELQNEVARLKGDADYFLRRGVDMQSAGNLREAKAAFEAVVGKFATSGLAGTAQQRLAIVDAAIAQAEADAAAKGRRKQEQQ